MNWGIVRTHAVALVALAVLVRALIPIGWMPSEGGLIPCDGHAQHSEHEARPASHDHMLMGHAAHAHREHSAPAGTPAPNHSDQRAGDGACPFAATALATQTPFIAYAMPVRVAIATVPIADLGVRERRIAFAGSPRGPPLFT